MTKETIRKIHYLLGDLRFAVGCLQPREDFKDQRKEICESIEELQDLLGKTSD